MKNFNIFFKDYLFLKIAFFVFTVILLFEQFLEYLIEKPTYTSLSKAKLGINNLSNSYKEGGDVKWNDLRYLTILIGRYKTLSWYYNLSIPCLQQNSPHESWISQQFWLCQRSQWFQALHRLERSPWCWYRRDQHCIIHIQECWWLSLCQDIFWPGRRRN